MGVSKRLVFEQGPVIASLIKTATMRVGAASGNPVLTPGPEIESVVPPRSPGLIRDYVRHVGGAPGWYKNTVPAHMFPQWGFPLLTKTLEGLPYDLRKVLNAGCQLEIRKPIPQGEPLHLSARLEEVDDNGQRVLIRQRLVTGTASTSEAMIATVSALIPLRRADKKTKAGPKKARPRVPEEARELGRWKLRPDAGLDFALLTGDFNPVHWIRPYAKAFGFRSTILHGFSTMARSVEALNRTIFAQDPRRLANLEIRFTRPLVLPAKVGVYVDSEGGLFVGDAPGGPAYLTGRFTKQEY